MQNGSPLWNFRPLRILIVSCPKTAGHQNPIGSLSKCEFAFFHREQYTIRVLSAREPFVASFDDQHILTIIAMLAFLSVVVIDHDD